MKTENAQLANEVQGVTPEMISAWKKQYGKIFKTTVDDEEYYWRRLKRKEYVALMSDRSEDDDPGKVYDRQELIAKAVVLYPAADIEDRIENCAGLATVIADEVIYKSGFGLSGTEEA